MALACENGDGTPVEVTTRIEPGFIVQTIPNNNSKLPDKFTANSFHIQQEDISVNLWQLSVCGKGFFTDCVYMFDLLPGETKFNPEDLKGYAQKSELFHYGELVIISGVIDHLEGGSGVEGCLLVEDTIRTEN